MRHPAADKGSSVNYEQRVEHSCASFKGLVHETDQKWAMTVVNFAANKLNARLKYHANRSTRVRTG